MSTEGKAKLAQGQAAKGEVRAEQLPGCRTCVMNLSSREHCVIYDVYKINDISASTRSRKIRPDY